MCYVTNGSFLTKIMINRAIITNANYCAFAAPTGYHTGTINSEYRKKNGTCTMKVCLYKVYRCYITDICFKR